MRRVQRPIEEYRPRHPPYSMDKARRMTRVVPPGVYEVLKAMVLWESRGSLKLGSDCMLCEDDVVTVLDRGLHAGTVELRRGIRTDGNGTTSVGWIIIHNEDMSAYLRRIV